MDATAHFVLVPLMAQGHTIPMVDMAHLLASRGVHVTFVTTPANASRMESNIQRARGSGLPIRFVSLRFPCEEFGLPQGCENLDCVTSTEHAVAFLHACRTLGGPLTSILRQQNPPPSCVISDTMQYWTGDMARELGIPRFMFSGSGGFSHLFSHLFHQNKSYDKFPGSLCLPEMAKFREEMMEEDCRSDGVVVNTFSDLEALCIDQYQEIIRKKVWTIGPMFLCNRDAAYIAARGNKASVDQEQCLRWLDSMQPTSVIYVSFGSLARTSPSQVIEIGLGLEASNCPFLWVVKAGNRSAEVETWLSQGFEERISSRGLIIRGWAPQVMILSHPAIGGFMTHCGWNSLLEGIASGVPMITWPHFAEQFLNEKLIVEVLRIGVAIGVKTRTPWAADNDEVLVKKDDVVRAVSRLMGEGEEGEARRNRSRELGHKARAAVEEGGSSFANLTLLIQQIKDGINWTKE
ncbi:UDP-glucoronosyl and UDP-glucosyl transferase [Musa troglodytarum]|uniref:Glycosyltransferase n=1 Tax=Musa troglodytarum TaxID=320322 RepID=A0A9E7G3N8_9LILI|nr:UDP-glucoronosyl and UDP-glucosyl transferase [Musa troglodytarum]